MTANKMAQWVKAGVPKPDNLNSIPKNHVIEGENQPLQVVLTSTRALCFAHSHAHKNACIHTHIKCT